MDGRDRYFLRKRKAPEEPPPKKPAKQKAPRQEKPRTPEPRENVEEENVAVEQKREKSPVEELPLDNLELEDDNLDHFKEEIEAHADVNRAYGLMKFKNEVILKNIRDSKNPSGLMLHLFDSAIQRAMNIGRKYLRSEPAMIGMTITHQNIERPIWRPLRRISEAQNTAISLLREFKKVNQSGKNGSMLDAPIRMEVVIAAEAVGRGGKRM